MRLLSRLEDRLIRWINKIFDLCADRIDQPCKAVVNMRDIVETNEEQHGNGDCPNTIKAVLHVKIILPA